MLRTKGIYEPISKDDGTRICVMSRLTDNTGRRGVPDLYKAELLDEWLPKLSSEKLVVAWYRSKQDDKAWAAFERGYWNYLQQPRVKATVAHLAERALTEIVTLLCVEATPHHCHRRILAEACREYRPKLELHIQ